MSFRPPTGVAVAITVATLMLGLATAQETPTTSAFTLTAPDGHQVHIFPTVGVKAALQPTAGIPPLLYHSGGSIMQTVTAYAIFWLPSTGKLQNGAATTLPAAYRNLQTRFLTDYFGHGIDNNNTQYFQTIGTTTNYIQNKGSFGGSYLDTAAYPASGCTDSATPGNCITDAQIQAEIARVMNVKGWTGGLNKMFLLFTSSGEGSCFTSAGTSCAYVQYCAYHGNFASSAGTVIYGNEPYGNLSVCQASGIPSPNNNAVADAAISIASHELTEAITDPLLNAWYTSDGYEIGDICGYSYGTNTWNAGKANESWNGHFYELQTEYDNHFGGCVQVGP